VGGEELDQLSVIGETFQLSGSTNSVEQVRLLVVIMGQEHIENNTF